MKPILSYRDMPEFANKFSNAEYLSLFCPKCSKEFKTLFTPNITCPYCNKSFFRENLEDYLVEIESPHNYSVAKCGKCGNIQSVFKTIKRFRCRMCGATRKRDKTYFLLEGVSIHKATFVCRYIKLKEGGIKVEGVKGESNEGSDGRTEKPRA